MRVNPQSPRGRSAKLSPCTDKGVGYDAFKEGVRRDARWLLSSQSAFSSDCDKTIRPEPPPRPTAAVSLVS